MIGVPNPVPIYACVEGDADRDEDEEQDCDMSASGSVAPSLSPSKSTIGFGSLPDHNHPGGDQQELLTRDELKRLRRVRLLEGEVDFPDEVDTPSDVPARQRFAR